MDIRSNKRIRTEDDFSFENGLDPGDITSNRESFSLENVNTTEQQQAAPVTLVQATTSITQDKTENEKYSEYKWKNKLRKPIYHLLSKLI